MAIDLAKGVVFTGVQTSDKGSISAESLDDSQTQEEKTPDGATVYSAIDGVFNTVLSNGKKVSFKNGKFYTSDESIIKEMEYFVNLGTVKIVE